MFDNAQGKTKNNEAPKDSRDTLPTSSLKPQCLDQDLANLMLLKHFCSVNE